ncbi:hypothetical protein GCM10012280_37800 [Wenjunlia tyrosinilytica]|uniref:Uncharacterized protein n=2 Tax=Wenjunlia tyrosinilytica TaxID=1544741 RepID=A0A918DY53_9ACTN|nr:hypothetical protein GCM10012280_37800 [Wenjunlia tyrosinilytica]
MRVVDTTLRDLDGQESRRGEGLSAMAGVLHLRAAVIAGRAGDGDHADARLNEARALARRTGELSDYGVGWGPANVGVHAVAIASDLDEYGRAVQLAEEVRFPRGWDRARAGHHRIDLGRAHTLAGHPNDALSCPLKARRTAAQQTRYHPTARETTVLLCKGPLARRQALLEFAEWIGV